MTPGVDFFRVDRSGATRRRLIFAGVLVACGSTTIGAHLVTRLPSGLAHLISLGGGLVMITGLLTGFGTMALMLFEDVYLLIQEDGLVVHDNGKETTVPWESLATVETREGFVVFGRDGEAKLEWFAGRGAQDLARRVNEARRKGVHGLQPIS